MKCKHDYFPQEQYLDPDMRSPPCPNDAVWNDRCARHGGVVPSVPELMILLGKLTSWGDQSLSVSMGYKRARVYTAQDESHLDDKTRGFTVETKICGQDCNVHAQGPTLEEALWALCRKVEEQLSKTRERAAASWAAARAALDEFRGSNRVP